MSVTASSLLEQVKASQPQGWRRLVRLYGPLVYAWGRRMGLQSQDAADVAQEVYRVVATRIADFQHAGPGAFRGWLKTITRNKVHDLWRQRRNQPVGRGGSTAQLRVAQLPAQANLDSTDGDNTPQEIGQLYRRALQLVQGDFEPSTWRAFWGVVIEGRSAADVAADLGTSTNAVYIAKSRVLSRLRSEFEGLID